MVVLGFVTTNDRAKIKLVNRPIYIKIIITSFETILSLEVIPVVIPTVPIAEAHSNTTSARESSL